MVCAANHVGDAHVKIVRHHAQVVSWVAVGTDKNEIFNVAVFGAGRSENLIFKNGLPGFGHAKTKSVWTVFRAAAIKFGRRHVSASAVIFPRAFFRLSFGAFRLQFFTRTPTRVRVAHAKELRRQFAVTGNALRLAERAFVPCQSQPSHAFQDCRFEILLRAVHVRIFNPQDKYSPLMAREKPVEEGGTRSANVEEASGRRRKTNSDFGHIESQVFSAPKLFRRESVWNFNRLPIESGRFVISESATCQVATPAVRRVRAQSSLRPQGGMNMFRRCVAFILRPRRAGS